LAPQVIWAYIFCTPSLDPMYLSFLNHHGEKPRPVLDAIAAMQQGLALPIASLNALRATKGLPALPADAAFSYMPHLPHGIAAVANFVHPWVPGHSWWAELHHAWRYWLKGLKLAVPVYMPVFATTTLLFGRARFMAAPLPSLLHYLGSVAQASVFLSNYCTVGLPVELVALSVALPGPHSDRYIRPLQVAFWWQIICRHYLGMRHDVMGSWAQLSGISAGAIAGLAAFGEKPGRRIELGLYVWTHGIRSWLWTMREWGVWRAMGPWAVAFEASPVAPVAWAVVSMAAMGHAFIRHPEFIRKSYLSTLSHLWDSEEKQQKAIMPRMVRKVSKLMGINGVSTPPGSPREGAG
jgi:hypothetical protein